MAQTGQDDGLQEYLQTLQDTKALLFDDPDNEELQAICAELEGEIAARQPDTVESASPPPPPAHEDPITPEVPKWDPKKHPAFQDSSTKAASSESKPVEVKANDLVMGKWPGDGREYKAKVLTITGSRNAPMYHVKWMIDNSTDTLPAHNIKPIANDFKKRKADGSTAASATASNAVANPGVISAPPNINSEAAKQSRPEPSKVSDGPARPAKIPKKISTNKVLEGHKSNWSDFQNKNKYGKKTTKKDSMFRTGEGVHARVGFTGSGKAMQKDPARSRHIYQKGDEDAQ